MTSGPAVDASSGRAKRRGPRARGVVRHTRGLGSHDHVCWRYHDPAEFRLRAGEFLADGLAGGQRVCYVGSGEPEALAEELSAVPGMRAALAAGAARVASVRGTYLAGGVVDPDEQVASYRELTEQALADGFSGLRVAADVTPLVGTAEQVDAFARYEHRIDRYMATRPFAAMCAYDAGQLGADTVAQAACMHPATSPDAAPFRLHATHRPGCAAAVGGELDLATAELWPRALARADLRPIDGELVLDVTELTFVDHRSLLQLVGYADRYLAEVVLRGAPPVAERLAHVMNLTTVRLEAC